MSDMTIRPVPLTELTADPQNVRQHDDRNLTAIQSSLEAFGQRKPIVCARANDGSLVVIAGNGTLAAARALGWTHLDVAEVPADWDADKARAYAIADNRTAELANWDDFGLANALVDLEAVGWDMETLGFEPQAGEVEPVEETEPTPEPPADPVSKSGDVWLLGKHRLVCGDSTTPDAFELVMDGKLADLIVTDPPYGVSYTGGQNDVKREMLLNDDGDVFAESIPLGYVHSKPDAALYAWFADRMGHLAFDAIRSSNYQVRAMVVWHKLKAHYGAYMAQYMPKFEPVLYCHKKGESPKWRGPSNEVTVWEYDQPARNEYHPTQKPVEVIARAIQNSSDPGDIVLDYFAGSGTTLIAAEQTGRVAYLIELDPRYCDVIVQRWENLTGQKATRSDG